MPTDDPATYCYSCTAPAVSREHVPPRCLFPESRDVANSANLRVNLITVPACAEHNLCKSGDDEYFLYVLSTSITSNTIARNQVKTKLTRAIARRPTLAMSLLEGSENCKVRDSATGKIHSAAQCNLNGARFRRSLELIANGIFYHHFGSRWDGALQVHADFIDFPNELNAAAIQNDRLVITECADKIFKTEQRYGLNPDVFFYQVHEPRDGLRCLLRLVFYDNSRAIAFFGADVHE